MKKTCLRCGQDFAKSSSHLSKNKECEPIYLNISRETILKEYHKYLEEFFICKYKKNNKTDYENNNQKYKCEFCSKSYSYKTSYYKHKRLYHKDNNSVNIVNSNNTTNNITNNFNISINNFGNEKKLNGKSMAKLLNGPTNKILSEYVKQTYVNISENRNIFIPNIRGKFVQVYINGKWEYKLLIPIVINVIYKSSEYIKYYISECDKKLIEEGKNIEDDIGLTKKINIKNHLYDIKEDTNKKKIAKDEVISELINGREKIFETKKSI